MLHSISHVDDGNIVELEVEGQAVEFDSEYESEHESSQSNNNAQQIQAVEATNNDHEMLPADNESDDEVQIQKVSPQAASEAERADMQKFINYMKEQGLVMVQTSQQANSMKFWNRREKSVPIDRPVQFSCNHEGEYDINNINGVNLLGDTLQFKQTRINRMREFGKDDNNSVVTVYQNAVNQAQTIHHRKKG